jgi:hypothetical protein
MIRLPWQKKDKILKEKLELIEFAFRKQNLKSFADLGGVWGVEGGYTFHALDNYNIVNAALVDTHPTEFVKVRSHDYPALRVIKGNFGDDETAREVGTVDAVFLFDVLLHQVAPDWDKVIELYAPNVSCFVIYNQQWTGSFSTVRLLDLGEAEYFRNVPHKRSERPYADLFKKLDEKHPDHDRNWRDVHHIWQWGITDGDLEQVLGKLGFKVALKKNYGRFARLANFENHGYVFTR